MNEWIIIKKLFYDDAFDVLHVETEYVLSWYVKRFYQQSRKITTKSESIVK